MIDMQTSLSKLIFSIIFLIAAFIFSDKVIVPNLLSIESFSPSTQVAQVIPTSGLIAHWKFDEGSGTTAGDSAGSNTGTLTNGPTWTSGKVGGAIEFDGINDRVSNTSVSISGAIKTFSYWIKNDTAGSIKTLSTLYIQDQGKRIWVYKSAAEKIALQYCNNIACATNYSTFTLGINEWTHIAVVHNGTSRFL